VTPPVLLLLALGTVCLALRVHFRQGIPLLPDDSIWRLTYHVNGRAKLAGAKLHAALPSDTHHSRVLPKSLVLTFQGAEQTRPAKSEAREIGVLARQPGKLSVVAQFDLHLRPRAGWRVPAEPALSAENRAEYLRSRKGIEVEDPVVVETLGRLRADPAVKSELVDRVFDFCQTDIRAGGKESPAERSTVQPSAAANPGGAGKATAADKPGAKEAPSTAAAALKQRWASPLGRARAMVALCRAAKIPARLVTGLEIRPSDDLRPHVWVEAMSDGRWEPYDPLSGFAHELPHNYVPLRRDGGAIVRESEMAELRLTLSARRIPPPPGQFREEGPRLVDVLDLTRLPLELHAPLSLILLMPLGALLTSFFRTVIGVRTFGTFTPTLLALAFVYNHDWRTGLLVFFAVLLLGLVNRAALERLKLLMVPRLSVMLTLVVLTMVFGVSLSDYLHWSASTQPVLLPMVILTMTVERYYLTTEEDGPKYAVQLLAGTMLLAFLCYLVLTWDPVGQRLLKYPELHLFTIAALVLLGRYTGYRLTELWRFREFGATGGEGR
jgi:transglutaminase-like putative cysteine protease